MRKIKQNIEQLEEAAHHFDRRTPTAARLALLLLDNLAELLMYERLSIVFARDSEFESFGRSKYSIKKRQEVMGHFFDKKVNFLVSETKDITQDDGEILKFGHQLRNEAYHKGLVHDSIIHDVVAVYLETVCGILPRFWSGGLAIWSPNEVADFLQKYGIESRWINRTTLEEVCQYISNGRACPIIELCEALSDDLVNRIEETIDGLKYLASRSRLASTPESLLKEMQVFKKLESDYNFPKTKRGYQQFKRKYDELMREYKPPISMVTIERWKQRAKALKSERMPGAVLRKYADLDRTLSPLEDEVSEGVFQYDMMIDAQVHDV